MPYGTYKGKSKTKSKTKSMSKVSPRKRMAMGGSYRAKSSSSRKKRGY